MGTMRDFNPWVATPRPRSTVGYVLARYSGFMRRQFYRA